MGTAPSGGPPPRGGPQRIPRPARFRPGGAPPWSHLAAEDLALDGDDVRRRFEQLGPPVPSPREPDVERASAVLAPLYEHDGQLWVILTRRSAALRSHSGEVSFPGGRQEAGEDLRTTALRETCEEVGLDPASVEIVGELDHLSTFSSNSFIVPFVALVHGTPNLAANPAEVAAVLRVPLAELLDPQHFREEHWDLWDQEWPMWFFDLEGDTVWGATAAMLRQLLGLLTGTVERGEIGHI